MPLKKKLCNQNILLANDIFQCGYLRIWRLDTRVSILHKLTFDPWPDKPILYAGKTIGSQPVAQLESLSLRGRRKKVTYDEEESVDDLLKSVKTADAKEQPKEEETQEEDDDGKDDDGVKESATKLPTGRKVGSQKVIQRFLSFLYLLTPGYPRCDVLIINMKCYIWGG